VSNVARAIRSLRRAGKGERRAERVLFDSNLWGIIGGLPRHARGRSERARARLVLAGRGRLLPLLTGETFHLGAQSNEGGEQGEEQIVEKKMVGGPARSGSTRLTGGR